MDFLIISQLLNAALPTDEAPGESRTTAPRFCAGRLLPLQAAIGLFFFTTIVWGASPATTPEASLRSIQVQPGFRVELMAAEPLIADPIAIAWGADDTLWVVEMGDYPSGPEASDEGGGRIRVLHDDDGDGTFDRSTLFLDGLRFPTGVLPWRKGALVTCAPDIFYAEDTDADGKADRREVLFTGFVEENPQHRVNSPSYGLDGWVHCANGDSGGAVRSSKTGETVNIRGRDFRILPEKGVLDPETGMSQFTRCRDDWGNWFGGNSIYPFWHAVIADRYIRRNPYLVPPDLSADLMSPPLYAPVHPISGPAVRFNEPHSARRFTSACGATVYRDELLGPEFSGAYFVCEPAHNLVRAERMVPRGATFCSQPLLGPGRAEFFASSDPWCRPTQVKTGPDGALWIVDMYRRVIEHPDFIPPSLHDRLHFRAGADKGRIYRVYPEATAPRQVDRLDRLDTAELVASLASPNGPQRDASQRLLVQRGSGNAVPLLEKLVTTGSRPNSRLQALATLDAIASVDVRILRSALGDSHPGVRKLALKIAESRLDNEAKLQQPVLAMVDDPDAQVRLQLACSLGQWQDCRAARALARLATKDVDDGFMRTAVLSSATAYADLILQETLSHGAVALRHAPLIRDLFLLALDSGREAACASALQRITAPADGAFAAWQFDVVVGLLDGLDRRGSSLEDLLDRAGPEAPPIATSLNRLLEAARTLARDRRASAAHRVLAVRLLGRGLEERRPDVDLLISLVTPQSPVAVQEAAIATLAQQPGSYPVRQLLANWHGHAPSIRDKILDEAVTRPEWIDCLLALIESRQIAAAAVGMRHRFPLLTHRTEEIRNRAQAAFKQTIRPNRDAVIEAYAGALRRQGKPQEGQRLFEKNCSACHQAAETGHVGPDLTALKERPAEALLIDILDPNRAVDPKYLSYAATTTSGKTLTGVLIGETDHAISLVDSQGKRHKLLRTELETLESTGQSLMPEGLEADISTPQAMADLLAFLDERLAAPGRRELQ